MPPCCDGLRSPRTDRRHVRGGRRRVRLRVRGCLSCPGPNVSDTLSERDGSRGERGQEVPVRSRGTSVFGCRPAAVRDGLLCKHRREDLRRGGVPLLQPGGIPTVHRRGDLRRACERGRLQVGQSLEGPAQAAEAIRRHLPLAASPWCRCQRRRTSQPLRRDTTLHPPPRRPCLRGTRGTPRKADTSRARRVHTRRSTSVDPHARRTAPRRNTYACDGSCPSGRPTPLTRRPRPGPHGHCRRRSCRSGRGSTRLPCPGRSYREGGARHPLCRQASPEMAPSSRRRQRKRFQ